jgi:hypothetical protein
MAPLPPTAESVVARLQKDAQVWERLLFNSGGLLKLKKCLYYIMFWEFDSEGCPSLRSAADIPSLLLTDGQDADAKPITQYDCTCAQKYIGLWNSPSLLLRANLLALQQKSNAYAKRLFKSGLTQSEVWLAYFACYVPSMTFTFPVASFTKHDLGTLQKLAVRATLARLGFNRNITRDFVYSSMLFGGLGLRDLFLELGIAQLELFIRHIRARTSQGVLFIIGLSWWHLVAGSSTPLIQEPPHSVDYVDLPGIQPSKLFLRISTAASESPLTNSTIGTHSVLTMSTLCLSSLA